MNLIFLVREKPVVVRGEGKPPDLIDLTMLVAAAACGCTTFLPHGWDLFVVDAQGRLFLNEQVGPAQLPEDGGMVIVEFPSSLQRDRQ